MSFDTEYERVQATYLFGWNKRMADAIEYDEVYLIPCKPAPLVACDEKDDIDDEADINNDAHCD